MLVLTCPGKIGSVYLKCPFLYTQGGVSAKELPSLELGDHWQFRSNVVVSTFIELGSGVLFPLKKGKKVQNGERAFVWTSKRSSTIFGGFQ